MALSVVESVLDWWSVQSCGTALGVREPVIIPGHLCMSHCVTSLGPVSLSVKQESNKECQQLCWQCISNLSWLMV